jgi:type II secretory pathway pseudopilin PulG
MRKNFKAFTLVEMLIVMGIIIILMAVGITAGRYAINRANDVAHQNAVDNFYTASQAYYADNRTFPNIEDFDAALIGGDDTTDDISEYMDEGAFDGGTEATYYYATDDLGQEVLVCVSLFGPANETGTLREGDFYCNGNAFGTTTSGMPEIDGKITERDTDASHHTPGGDTNFDVSQNWDGDGWEE